MHVVHAVLEDARSVAEIHVSSWQTAYKDLLPADYLASLSAEQREKWWRECISAGTQQLLVAKDNGSIVGWINFGKSRDDDAPESRAEIWALFFTRRKHLSWIVFFVVSALLFVGAGAAPS